MNRNLVLSRSLIASIVPAAALATAGIAATAPAQAATTTSVTAATAGTKALGATTYMWGTSTAPAGTTVCSQVSLNANWSTSQCSTIRADHSYDIELTYGKNYAGTYTFRAITQAANGVVTATSDPVTLTRGSSPVTPTKPSTPKIYQGGTLGDGYTLYSTYNGVKVYLVQQALGITYTPMSTTMGPKTTAALIAFQKNQKKKYPALRTDGVLDEATWNLLPIAKDKNHVRYPFAIDSWAKNSDVMADATRDVRVAAMISFAKAQIGQPYIWGGTGPIGYDCAGLLLQAARAGGMKPTGVGNFIDVRPTSDLSNKMMLDGEFQKGSLSNLHPGDFIYYGNTKTVTDGIAHHVSMYLGGNTVIEAMGSEVQTGSLGYNVKWRDKLAVNRAFAL